MTVSIYCNVRSWNVSVVGQKLSFGCGWVLVQHPWESIPSIVVLLDTSGCFPSNPSSQSIFQSGGSRFTVGTYSKLLRFTPASDYYQGPSKLWLKYVSGDFFRNTGQRTENLTWTDHLKKICWFTVCKNPSLRTQWGKYWSQKDVDAYYIGSCIGLDK